MDSDEKLDDDEKLGLISTRPAPSRARLEHARRHATAAWHWVQSFLVKTAPCVCRVLYCLLVIAWVVCGLALGFLMAGVFRVSDAIVGPTQPSPDFAAVAWNGVWQNTGPAAGVPEGVIIASPSKGDVADEPDYYYTWTRDAALTLSTVLPSFLPDDYLTPWLARNASFVEAHNGTLELYVRAFVAAQADIQTVETRSGGLSTGGLNEPKYTVDKAAFDGDWGRPQRDGPALRALALLPYANYLLDRGFPADRDYVARFLYKLGAQWQTGSVIRNDLDEVARGWALGGFDLWEEVDGLHLFTMLAAVRALQAGHVLAARLGDDDSARAYAVQAQAARSRLQSFYDGQGRFWRASLPADNNHASLLANNSDASLGHRTANGQTQWQGAGRTGKDCAVLLAANHMGATRSGARAEDEPILWAGDSDVLKTLHDYVLSFDGLYDINKGKWTSGWAVGRYAEDIYDGVGQSKGNPWYICTYAVAEALSAAQAALVADREIVIDDLSAPFWSDVVGKRVRPGTRWAAGGSSTFTQVVREIAGQMPMVDRLYPFERAGRRLGEIAKRFIEIGEGYAAEGRMSEQISRRDGSAVGARDLTWSYAAYLSASRARDLGAASARDAESLYMWTVPVSFGLTVSATGVAVSTFFLVIIIVIVAGGLCDPASAAGRAERGSR